MVEVVIPDLQDCLFCINILLCAIMKTKLFLSCVFFLIHLPPYLLDRSSFLEHEPRFYGRLLFAELRHKRLVVTSNTEMFLNI